MRTGTLKGRQEEGEGKPGLMKTTLTKKGKKKRMLNPNVKLITHNCPMSSSIHLFLGEWQKAFNSPIGINSAKLPVKHKDKALLSPKGLGMISSGKTCNMM